MILPLPFAFLTGSPMELIVLLVVVLIFFGPKRLPSLSRSIGKSISEFKRGKEEVAKELEEGKKEAHADTGGDEENKDS